MKLIHHNWRAFEQSFAVKFVGIAKYPKREANIRIFGPEVNIDGYKWTIGMFSDDLQFLL